MNFTLMKRNFRFDFSFFALIGISVLLRDKNYIAVSLLCCLLHECGHLLAMGLFKVRVKEIAFYGGGIKICADNFNVKKSATIIILIAGSFVNIVLCIITALIFTETKMLVFAALNGAIGVFNLLPVDYFDGGRLVDLIFCEKNSTTAFRIKTFLNSASTLFIFSFCAVAFYKSEASPSLLAAVIFISAVDLFGGCNNRKAVLK